MPVESKPRTRPKGRRATNARRKADMKTTEARRSKRKRTKALLADLRGTVLSEDFPLNNVKPEAAVQEALERAVAMARIASQEAGKIDIKGKDFWRDTIAGKVPNEWIRLERDMWDRVAQIGARMIQLNIDSRSAGVREQAADALATGIAAVVEQLGLTTEQREKLPAALEASFEEINESGERLAA